MCYVQESESKIVEFVEETVAEVDMLLLYLYTLAIPDFTAAQDTYQVAESALKLGDKYNLSLLREEGRQSVISQHARCVFDWPVQQESLKETFITRLGVVWKAQHSEAEIVRQQILTTYVSIAESVLEFKPFQNLCAAEPELALAFMRAQVKQLKEKVNATFRRR